MANELLNVLISSWQGDEMDIDDKAAYRWADVEHGRYEPPQSELGDGIFGTDIIDWTY
ncbi:MAG: hypothetical protein AAF074_16480 [Pseudomonadota bacterium]